jgi:hypothetical protein
VALELIFSASAFCTTPDSCRCFAPTEFLSSFSDGQEHSVQEADMAGRIRGVADIHPSFFATYVASSFPFFVVSVKNLIIALSFYNLIIDPFFCYLCPLIMSHCLYF